MEEIRKLRPLKIPLPPYQGFTPFKAYRWRLLVTAGMVTALAGLAMARPTVLNYSAFGQIMLQRAQLSRVEFERNTAATVTASKSRYPELFRVLIELDYATGGVNRDNPVKRFIDIPPPYAGWARIADDELTAADLRGDELIKFVDGEETEMLALVDAKRLRTAHRILEGYFNGWIE